jgi:hypothetical protein
VTVEVHDPVEPHEPPEATGEPDREDIEWWEEFEDGGVREPSG